MRRSMVVAMAACGGIAAVAVLAGAAGAGGLQLFDAPRGAWLAEVRPDAPVVVVEERDGWKRVRFEGWVPSGSVGGAAAADPGAGAPEGSAAAVPLATAAAATSTTASATAASATTPSATAVTATSAAAGSPGAKIQGVLMPTKGMVPATVGANLVVLLIADVEKYDAERQPLVASCRTRIEVQDQAAQVAQALVNTALNSTNNFTEASHRYDAAKADLAAAKKGRAAAVKDCLDQADALAERYAVSRAPSDTSGRFEFSGLGPGGYRIFSCDHRDGVDRAWAFDATTTPGATVVIDPLTAAAPDPYRGLN